LSALTLASIGLVAGSFLLRVILTQYIPLILGFLIVAFSLFNLFQTLPIRKAIFSCDFSDQDIRKERILCYLASSTAGILEGFLGLGGPPIVMYMVCRKFDSKRFLATFSSFFVLITPLRIIIYSFFNLLNLEVVKLLCFIIIFIISGLIIGMLIRKSLVDEQRFNLLVVILLIVIGISLIVRSF
jgi:uncharacterized membrane protein YfcA